MKIHQFAFALCLPLLSAMVLTGCERKDPPVKIDQGGKDAMDKAKAISDSVQKQDDQTNKNIDNQSK
ncbi:hypothetical protein [Amantichitinum ursilacus]|uniref:Lipoprotein n=1 Tax=Amantichitinum ursilacus TaxID=857265 RepID=A0A0N0XKH5_9NEIS|nr:hypothetical protein [Amantichitinum ursilacus]KPC54618.1 hypothetical protein WG78_03565 [Amantichitinum ursilacus]